MVLKIQDDENFKICLTIVMLKTVVIMFLKTQDVKNHLINMILTIQDFENSVSIVNIEICYSIQDFENSVSIVNIENC